MTIRLNGEGGVSSSWAMQTWNRAKLLIGNAAHRIPSLIVTGAIALPILAMAFIPLAEGAALPASNSTMIFIPGEPNGAVGFLQDAAVPAIAGFNFLGALGAVGHVLGEGPPALPLPANEDLLEMEEIEEISEKQKASEPLIRIEDRSDFSGVAPGAVALVVSQTRYGSVAIAKGQEFMGVQDIWRNITHAGIVSKKINESELAVQEIPDRAGRLSENLYSLTAMSSHEQMLFFHFHDVLPIEEREAFHTHLMNITGTFIERIEDKPQNNYNLESIGKMPFASLSFEAKDWDLLLADLMEYRLLSTNASYIPAHKRYFCSEFVVNCVQLARLMQRYPQVVARIDEAISSQGGDRQAMIQRIRVELGKEGILLKLASDPLFFVPAAQATPGSLTEFAMRHQLPISRISNPNPIFDESDFEGTVSLLASRRLLQLPVPESSSSSCTSVQGLDYHLNLLEKKWQNVHSFDPDASSLHCLMDFLLKQPEFKGYSKQTLQCVLLHCVKTSSDELSSCIGLCVEQTFTWREKIRLALTAVALDHTLDRLIENGQLGKLLDTLIENPNANLLNFNELVRLLFPADGISLTDLNQMQNYLINVYAEKFLSDVDIFKYGPIGVLGMNDVFEQFGWKVVPPIDRIQEFALGHFQDRFKADLTMLLIRTALQRQGPYRGMTVG